MIVRHAVALARDAESVPIKPTIVVLVMNDSDRIVACGEAAECAIRTIACDRSRTVIIPSPSGKSEGCVNSRHPSAPLAFRNPDTSRRNVAFESVAAAASGASESDGKPSAQAPKKHRIAGRRFIKFLVRSIVIDKKACMGLQGSIRRSNLTASR